MTQRAKPLLREYIAPKKQGAKRHYGIHPYFTRRPWNVVQRYIGHYAKAGGVVLDPFGGSGITAIEAAVLGCKGIQYDINPLANFIAAQIAAPDVDLNQIEITGREIILRARQILRKESQRSILKNYWYPREVRLPDNADEIWLEELFSPRQLVELAVLRQLIKDVANRTVRNLLLLAFSGTLAKTNRTFISAKNRAASRGGSTILSLYRYHVPKKPVELLPIDQFEQRLPKILAAKSETNLLFGKGRGSAEVREGSATNLKGVPNSSVDYIFTDPPYGSFIDYLDLSTMWNSWLGFSVSDRTRGQEIIASTGRETEYFDLLGKAARECHRVLKDEAFISVVFCHRDLSYWKKIYDLFTDAGFSYRISVPQPLNTIWSVHKKKCDLASLAGEVIVTFQKTKHAPTQLDLPNRGMAEIIRSIFESKKSLPTDELCLKLVPALYEAGLLDVLGNGKLLLTELLHEHLRYEESDRVWVLDRRRSTLQKVA